MKNLIAALAIFLLMIGIMSFSLKYLNDVCSGFRAESDQLEELIKNEDWETASKFSNDMLERWKKQATIIPMFVNHTEVDTLTNELLKLTQYVESNTKDESLASTHIVKFFLDTIMSLQKISLENIF